MEYKVIPSEAVIAPQKDTSEQVAEQLEAKIRQGKQADGPNFLPI